ncbi:hypothetical protein EDC96DRAFT_494337 [Choanephora cucurbitarum]|nr:hypothetical protein EDC96DRAFT_494337 [Choanephora cucurbitarum]
MYSTSCTLPPLSNLLIYQPAKPMHRSPAFDINNLLSNDVSEHTDSPTASSSVASISNITIPTTATHTMHHTTILDEADDKRQQRRNLKAKRKRASPNQLLVLNRIFSQTYFPSTEIRVELGKQLGMSPRTVQIWFQNKRQALRSRGRHAPAPSNCYLPPISPPRSPQSSYYYRQNHCQHHQEFNVSLPPLRLTQYNSPPSSVSFPSPNSMDYPF